MVLPNPPEPSPAPDPCSTRPSAFRPHGSDGLRRSARRGWREYGWLLVSVAVLAAGGLVAWAFVQQADSDLRVDLLGHAREAAGQIDRQAVTAVGGDEPTQLAPARVRLQNQLAAFRAACPLCRYICLVGRRPDGGCVVLVDDSPADSAALARSATVTDECGAGLNERRTESGLVTGPRRNLWGSVISASVALPGPASQTATRLRMDIDARSWPGRVWEAAALPVAATAALTLGCLAALAFQRIHGVQKISDAMQAARDQAVAAQVALQESQRIQHLALEIGRIGLYSLNPSTGQWYWSPQVAAILGVPDPQHADGYAYMMAHVHPEDRRTLAARFAELRETDDELEVELRVFRGDGELRWVRARAQSTQRLEQGAAGLVGVMQDITQTRLEAEELTRRVAAETARMQVEATGRHAAEDQLRKLSSALEQSPSAVAIASRDGTVEYVNRQFEVLTGCQAAAVVGQSTTGFRSADHPEGFYRDLWDQLVNGGTWRGQVRHQRRDGAWIWIAIAAGPVHDRQGRVSHIVSVCEDITERIRMNDQLQQAKDAADAADQAKNRFLASVSHEIRTPMNAILGYAQLLQRDQSLSPEQRQRLATINHNAEHLLRLISDVLDMSRLQAGRTSLSLADCDLGALLAEVEGMFSGPARNKGLSFVLKRDPDMPAVVLTDGVKVRQVLVNLLGNALKNTDAGAVTLGASGRVTSAAGARPAQAMITMEVADTGTGIAVEEQERLFEAFEQTESGQRRGSGTGLGLTISRELAHMLGGDLSLTSSLGVGSTFRFTFSARVVDRLDEPRSAPLPLRRRGADRASTAALPPALVVDDVRSNRDLLRGLLEHAGFAVEEAGDGAEAVALCETRSFGLVVMDQLMPGLDGVSATQAIRARARGRQPRILAVSANVTDSSRAEWSRAGADGFVAKPFRANELLDQVASMLGLELPCQTRDRPEVADWTEEPEFTDKPLPPVVATALPAELRSAIDEATEVGDAASLRRLVTGEVAALDPDLARALSRMLARYDYDAIRSAMGDKETT